MLFFVFNLYELAHPHNRNFFLYSLLTSFHMREVFSIIVQTEEDTQISMQKQPGREKCNLQRRSKKISGSRPGSECVLK